MSSDGRAKVTNARGEPFAMWNTAAAGRPSLDQVRSSVDEALAALEALNPDADEAKP